MGHPNRFFIVNEVDKPYERHVVEMFSGKKAAYIHPELIEWNKSNGCFQITDGCTDIEDFGFSIDIHGNKAVFHKTRPSIATYRDGSKRKWQGNTTFSLILHGSFEKPEVKSITTTSWFSSSLPGWRITNEGGNIYNVYFDSDHIDTFTQYGESKDKIVEEWFIEKIISNPTEDIE